MSEIQIDQNDVEILKKRGLKLIFVLGGPGSGKGTQCAKLVSDYKFNHISTGDCIRDEIKKGSKLGNACKEFSNIGKLVPFEVIIAILVKAILNREGKNFLIDGFPRAMDQALYLDKHFQEIKIILNVSAPDDILVKRLKGRGASSGRADDQDEKIIMDRINVFKNQSLPVINFYRKYGAVKDVDSSLDVNDVYKIIKYNLYPEIYCIVGKRYSGKTTIAKILQEKMQMLYISFDEFLKSPDLKKHQGDNEYLIQLFLGHLRKLSDQRVIIENFPLQKELYSLFVKNGKAIRKIIYLSSSNYSCSERMRLGGSNQPDFIGSGKLKQLNDEFEGNKDLLKHYSDKGVLVEIESDQIIYLVAEKVIEALKPQVFLMRGEESFDLQNDEVVRILSNDHHFSVLNVDLCIKESIQRGNALGQKLENSQGEDLILYTIEMLKPIIFNEQNSKYLLLNFPSNTFEAKLFEKLICQIDKVVYRFTKYPIQFGDFSEFGDNLELYYKEKNKLHLISDNPIDIFIPSLLGISKDINIVFGMPLSGKKVISNHLEKKYGYSILSFEKYIEDIKKEKAPDEPESITVDLKMFLTEFAKYISKMPKNKKLLLLNIVNPANTGLFSDIAQINKLIDVVGRFKTVFISECDSEPLKDRYKVKLGIPPEEKLNDDQILDFNNTLAFPTQILEALSLKANSRIAFNTSYSDEKGKQDVDIAIGKRLVLVQHDYSLPILNTLNYVATELNILHISVPHLIQEQFLTESKWYEPLKYSYCKKDIIVDYPNSHVYLDYNPIHFDPSLVKQMISEYISLNSPENPVLGNRIMLSGFFNNHLFSENSSCFNLPLFEIRSALDLGLIII